MYGKAVDNRSEREDDSRGAKYTRSRLPVELVYFEEFSTKEEAMSREWHIKRLKRLQKEKLIAGSLPKERISR